MHELTVGRQLFFEILESARIKGLDRIRKVKIGLGVASGIDKDLLQHSFIDHIFPNSIAEDAEVEIIKEQLTAKCNDCGIEFRELGQNGNCPSCGSSDLQIIAGMNAVLLDVT